MYQKDLVRRVWTAAGLYEIEDPKLQQFLKQLDDPTQCWTEMIQACRRHLPQYKAQIVQPIFDTDDPLTHLMLIRAASEPDELALLERYITKSDPVRDHVELKAIALKNIPRLNKKLAKKDHLTKAVSDVLAAEATLPPPPKISAARKAKPPSARPASGARP